jgi:hypothetical protein
MTRDAARAAARGARRGLPAAALALLSALAGLLPAACAEVGTGPSDAVSISFDSLPPSIVAGDVLRDANGDTVRLRAVAYNASGGTIADAPFRYIYVPARVDTTRRIDSALVIDSITGLVRAPRFIAADTTVRVDTARIAARLGPVLQIVRGIRIVQRPTALIRVPGDTGQNIAYVQNTARPGSDSARAQNDSNSSAALRVRVTRDSAGTAVGVPRYLVRYRIVQPARGAGDSALVLVLGTVQRQGTQLVDTTDNGGNAGGVRLRVYPSRFAGAAVPETVVVEASARYQTTELAGSPVRFTIPVRRRTTGR